MDTHATQAFNEDVQTSLRGLKQADSVADNILIHTQKTGQHKHDIERFLDRCLEEGITLKKEELTVCEKEVLWFGHMYGQNGVRPDPAKVQKLKEKGIPENQEDVRSFLQAAQFNARFMWDTDKAYADTTYPLRQLLRKKTPFIWRPEQQASYNDIIQALESAGSLYPYNPDLDIVHVADAQPQGIASSAYMITRNESDESTWWPLNHASRSLTTTETGYPQIDRESLAQVWGMKQHKYYLIGRTFTTFTDHKPLLPFYNCTKRPTPRVEKHILSVQDLSYKMEFMEGKQNPTDWNSRHPEQIDTWTEQQRRKHELDEGEEIRLNRVIAINKLDKILRDAGISGEAGCTNDVVIKVGSEDEVYTKTRQLVESGRRKEIEGEYKRVANELNSDGNLLLKEGKLVIPKGDGTLRQKIVQAAHEGHPGMSQVKSRLRGLVYWPGFTTDVEHECKPCLACQVTTEGKHHRDKLTPSKPPARVWSKVGADHWGPLPDGSARYILVLQDYLTKYPEAVVVSHTAAKDNIRALEEIFGRHGYPDKFISDNGPPWNGLETHPMQKYLTWAGVEHLPTKSAEDPEANGLAERFMQKVGKSWETAYVEGKDPLAALNTMLKTYRNTEHSVTRRKPAEWLFGRIIRTRIPDARLQTQHDDEDDAMAKERIISRGEKEKVRRDAHAREENLDVGMKVLLKNKKRRKGYRKYDPKPFTITELVGRQAVLERGDTVLRRETQKFKRLFGDESGDNTKVSDDWEETRQIQNDILTVTPHTDVLRHDNLQTIATASTESTTLNTVPVVTETAEQASDDNTESPPRRTSTRSRNAPNMYGSWVTPK